MDAVGSREQSRGQKQCHNEMCSSKALFLYAQLSISQCRECETAIRKRLWNPRPRLAKILQVSGSRAAAHDEKSWKLGAGTFRLMFGRSESNVVVG